MSATRTVTVDREALERFIIEIDAIATLDSILHGGAETALQTRIYRATEAFEQVAFGVASPDNLHDRAITQGYELAREMFAELFEGRDAE